MDHVMDPADEFLFLLILVELDFIAAFFFSVCVFYSLFFSIEQIKTEKQKFI